MLAVPSMSLFSLPEVWCHTLALLTISNNWRSLLPSGVQIDAIYQVLVNTLYLRVGISERMEQVKKFTALPMLNLKLNVKIKPSIE